MVIRTVKKRRWKEVREPLSHNLFIENNRDRKAIADELYRKILWELDGSEVLLWLYLGKDYSGNDNNIIMQMIPDWDVFYSEEFSDPLLSDLQKTIKEYHLVERMYGEG